MIRLPICIALFAAGASGMMAGQGVPALAEDFRVDNTVYSGSQKEPSSESTTIFHGGVVYDCMKLPAETVVFDKAAGRFVVLNLTRQTRTELTTGEVIAFIDRLQTVAAKSKDPLVKFLAKPKFEERSEEAAGELTLSSPLVSYRMTLSHEMSQGVAEQYHEFCDWYARLNALLVPGSRPPFGRLVVNAALAQRQATASQVLLTLTSGKGLKQQQTTIRSEHRVVRPLEPGDLERVARIRELVSGFKLVSFNQYRKTDLR
jgi:hypothetical protein